MISRQSDISGSPEYANISAKLPFPNVGSREPLPTCITRGEGRSHSSNDNKDKNSVFEPVFGFGLGGSLIVIGAWWYCFTSRYNQIFLLLGASTLLVGFLIMAFADVVQSTIDRLALSAAYFLMLSDGFGIGA